jgi:glutamate-1-semialdehyde 2,1-aminomutase
MDTLITDTLRSRLEQLRDSETATFDSRTPRSKQWLAEAADVMPNGVPMSWMVGFWRHSPVVAVSGRGSMFTDLDGNSYRDFNLCDLAMAAGFAPEPIVAAVTEQAARGNHFLLPTTDSVDVSRLLAERFGLPRWQFTLSASGANVDALRLARAYTGRTKVLVFEAKYHGHFEEMLFHGDEPDALGLVRRGGANVEAVPFNDVPALTAALAEGDVAAVLLEPVMTNCGLVMPQPGYHQALRDLTREHGTLLVVDETHTQFAVYGGGTRDLGLDPDIVTGGKGIGGGVPVGVFGMTVELSDFLADHMEGDFTPKPGVATGGTVYANALSMAAAKAGLSQVFTAQAHARVDALGASLQEGLQSLVDKSGLGFTIDRWGGRCQWRLTKDAPLNGHDGYVSVDEAFADSRKAFFMNRGIWDAIATSGPAVSFAATQGDVDAYLDVSEQFLATIS